MKSDLQNRYFESMLRVLVHIQENLDQPLDLEELSSVSGFSPAHFHRVFKGMIGETVMEHVRRLRLERAALRLIRQEESATMIGLDAGYETLESFSRAFKTMFGLSPSKFRTDGAKNLPPSASGVHYLEGGEPLSLTPIKGENMQVNIEKRNGFKIAFVRHIGPYKDCGRAWEKLCAFAGPQGLLGPNTRFVGLSYDDPSITPPDKIRYDAAIVLDREIAPSGEIGVREVPGGDFAVTLHKGPYEKLESTYAALFGQWLPKSGREAVEEGTYEFYLNDCKTTPPEELLTEINIRLA